VPRVHVGLQLEHQACRGLSWEEGLWEWQLGCGLPWLELWRRHGDTVARPCSSNIHTTTPMNPPWCPTREGRGRGVNGAAVARFRGACAFRRMRLDGSVCT
jgi:hypothetical protein